MSAPKIAYLFSLAGVLGLIVSVLTGPSELTDYLLDGSFVCIAIGGLIFLLYVLVTLWADFVRSDDWHRTRP